MARNGENKAWLKRDLSYKYVGGGRWYDDRGSRCLTGDFRMVVTSPDDPDVEGAFLAPGPHYFSDDMIAQIVDKDCYERLKAKYE